MNKELDNTAFLAGDFISENAVRGALERRPRTLPTRVAEAGDRQSTDLSAVEDASPRTSRARRLRRWSVAELIARAVARSPTGGVAH